MSQRGKRNPRIQNQSPTFAYSVASLKVEDDDVQSEIDSIPGMSNRGLSPPVVPAGQSSPTGVMTQSEIVGLAVRRGLTFPEVIWVVLSARSIPNATVEQVSSIIEAIGGNTSEVVQIQQWLDRYPPFATLGDAIARFDTDANSGTRGGMKTFNFAYVPVADTSVPYRPSGQGAPGAGPSPTEVIGIAINRGADAANNLIREANATRRAEIEAEARVALAEIAQRNGGQLPNSGQDAQTVAILQALMATLASSNRPAPDRTALYVGGAVAVAAIAGVTIYFATRK